MRGAYAIGRHEFLRRWPLVLVGLGLGLVVSCFSPASSPHLAELAEMLATISIVVCWIVAFSTGMSLVGRPLHDGRLSFYFTRPISSAGIVGGKILGGLLAIACMHAALALPLAYTYTYRGPDERSGLAETSMFVGSAFFVVGLVVGILARSRSRWFLADIIGAAIAAVVAVGMFAGFGNGKLRIAQNVYGDEAKRLLERADTYLYALVAAAAVALLLAVVAAIVRGRTDRELVHRGLSITLWPALTAIGLVGLALAQWGLQ